MTCTWCDRFGDADHALKMAGVQTLEGQARSVRRAVLVLVGKIVNPRLTRTA